MTEKASVVRSLVKAHAQLVVDRITESNKRRFLTGQEIRLNGQLAKKSGGTGRNDELADMLNRTRGEITVIDAKLYVNEGDLKYIREAVRDIMDGKMDDVFI